VKPGATSKMQGWYEHPSEQDRWGECMPGQGLFPTESALVEKHFKAPGRVLNVGCGGGREAAVLSGRFEVVAVDFMQSFCCSAARRLSATRAPVLRMNATDLAFADGAFDYAIMVGQLIGQIPGRANRVRALAEIFRVLTADGSALVSTNAIEFGLRYRAYFAVVNQVRRLYNPYALEADDAFIFHEGGRFSPFGDKSRRAVFHWYRTPEFLKDAHRAGFKLVEYRRRFEFEKSADRSGGSTGGETFYVLKKTGNPPRES